jgi:hypothetical protein
MSTEAHCSGLVPSSADARSWRQRPLRTDNVNHLGRSDDNHPGRFDGDDCRRLMVHVVAPVNGRCEVSATVPRRRAAAKAARRTTVGRRRGPLRVLSQVAGHVVRPVGGGCLSFSFWWSR